MEQGLQGRKVLVVDDDVDSAELLAELLRMAGAETALAHDGPGALELLARFQPDLALVDIELSGGTDGFALARAVGAQTSSTSSTSPPRLVAVTGHGEDWARRESLGAGFAAHVVKPIDSHALVALLVRVLG